MSARILPAVIGAVAQKVSGMDGASFATALMNAAAGYASVIYCDTMGVCSFSNDKLYYRCIDFLRSNKIQSFIVKALILAIIITLLVTVILPFLLHSVGFSA